MRHIWISGLIVALGLAGPVYGQSALSLNTILCPVLKDEPIVLEHFVDYQGHRVYFCCDKCRAKFIKEPQKYAGFIPIVQPPEKMAYIEQLAKEGRLAELQESKTIAGTVKERRVPLEQGQPMANQGPTQQRWSWEQWIRFAGKFHPITVHFPIALVMTAGLAELLNVLTKRDIFAQTSHFCIVVGAFSAVVALSLGLADAWFLDYQGEMNAVLTWHRWCGISVGVAASVTAYLSYLSRAQKAAGVRQWYLVMLTVSVILVGVTGFFGGQIGHGIDYFSL